MALSVEDKSPTTLVLVARFVERKSPWWKTRWEDERTAENGV
jgi:hypothetical protein